MRSLSRIIVTALAATLLLPAAGRAQDVVRPIEPPMDQATGRITARATTGGQRILQRGSRRLTARRSSRRERREKAQASRRLRVPAGRARVV